MLDEAMEYAPSRQPPPSDNKTRSLPEGWLRQFDSNYNACFYVDTLASPPRSIWVHPYDDPQYLGSHPHVRGHDRLPEHQGNPSSVPISTRPRHMEGEDKEKAPEKRGLLRKLKDTVIGTKEEREAVRRLREEKQHHGKHVRSQFSSQELGDDGMVAGLGGGLLLADTIDGGSGGDSGGDFGGNFGGGGDCGGGNSGGGGDCGGGF